jgi:hypothetical protein
MVSERMGGPGDSEGLAEARGLGQAGREVTRRWVPGEIEEREKGKGGIEEGARLFLVRLRLEILRRSPSGRGFDGRRGRRHQEYELNLTPRLRVTFFLCRKMHIDMNSILAQRPRIALHLVLSTLLIIGIIVTIFDSDKSGTNLMEDKAEENGVHQFLRNRMLSDLDPIKQALSRTILHSAWQSSLAHNHQVRFVRLKTLECPDLAAIQKTPLSFWPFKTSLADNSELCQKKDKIIDLFEQLLKKLGAEVRHSDFERTLFPIFHSTHRISLFDLTCLLARRLLSTCPMRRAPTCSR